MTTEASHVDGAEEMHLKAGDALFALNGVGPLLSLALSDNPSLEHRFFQDSILHGSAARTNPGYRKTLCFRYNPAETTNFRHAHTPSDALMSRLTPRQRQCLTELPNAGDNWGTKDGVTKSYFEHHWRGGPQASADVAALQQEVKELRALVASQAGAPQQSKL